MVRNLVYTLTVIFFSLQLFAQNEFGEIRGKVFLYNKNKSIPIKKASVQLLKNNVIISTAKTNKEGFYIIKNIKPDSNYLLRVNKKGYDFRNYTNVEVNSNMILFENFRLPKTEVHGK